jgi:hypothetical protein
MTAAKKMVSGTLLLIILSISGCIFFMRSCLAKYDERSALPTVLYFEKDGKMVLIAIVKYDKTVSYSRKGGHTSKSVSTTYFLQSNDGVTGAKLGQQKIKDHSDIKEYPVETLGAANQLAWIFAGEIMAFDPFTLEKKADPEILETKNPTLKGRLPKERQYYTFNRTDGSIFITATDGTKWKLNTATMLAVANEGVENPEPYEAELTAAKAMLEQAKKEIDSSVTALYKQQNAPSLRQTFYTRRDLLYKKSDSLNKVKYSIENLRRKAQENKRTIEHFQDMKMGKSYSQIKKNSDTGNGNFYGLYTAEEFKKIYNRFDYHSEYDETSRRKFLTTTLTAKDDYLFFDKEKAAYPNPTQSFLHGGFLLDKNTGMPVRIGSDRLVLHKTQIGKDGHNQITRIDTQGKSHWTADTKLSEWIDWFVTTKYLYIFGQNNEALSTSDCNVLLTIDITSGKINGFDYFTDKPVVY